ncbi:prohibitin family protein [bacterium]|nr:prohibitin family protein [bacterium]
MLFLLLAVAGIALFNRARRLTAPAARFGRVIGGLLALVGVIGVLAQSIVSIPAGHVGLKDFFGKIGDGALAPGLHLVNPLLTIREMDVRTQEITETASVPSKEGMNMSLDISMLYSVEPTKAAAIYRTIGPDYAAIFVVPTLRSELRGATTAYEAKALYTSQRQAIAETITGALRPILAERGIRLEQVLLRSVTLPPQLAQAIENKLQAEQESERMRFVLDRERQEAERKKIEAQGIADFQAIVSEGINQNLLRWKGIEATQKLAESANAKVVIVGGQDGLPLILNTQ